MDTLETSKNGHELKQESSVGPIIGSLIIVIILMVAAVYYWGQHLNTLEEQNLEAKKIQQDLQQSEGNGTILISTSTNISDIEKDLDVVSSSLKMVHNKKHL